MSLTWPTVVHLIELDALASYWYRCTLHVSRSPAAPLRPFVQRVWVSDESTPAAGANREYVVPTGAMHVVVRLRGRPLRVYDTEHDQGGRIVGTAVVGGARQAFYVRDVSYGSCSVGAMLHPGAALPLLGVPAEALAERHTALDDLWGRDADRIRERLLALRSPAERLDLFEAMLAQRLPRVLGIHTGVAHALAQFEAMEADVRTVVRDTGYSHRRFITLFREAVGLSPKRYCRVLRFQRVLQQVKAAPRPQWSQIALAAGFSDQAHLVRDFREFAGVTPTEFERLAPRHTHHVPVRSATSNSFKTPGLQRVKLRS